MEFEYSNNPYILKRIKSLKKSKLILYIIICLLIITMVNLMLIIKDINSIIFLLILFIIMVSLSVTIYMLYISNIIKDSFERELNPELLLNLNIYLLENMFLDKNTYNYILNDIALAYLYDGNFDKAEEVLDFLEKRNLNKIAKALSTQKRMEIYFYQKDYKKVKKLKEQLLVEIEGLNKNIKNEVLFDLDVVTAIMEEDKDKLNIICSNLEKRSRNIDRAEYLYIKSLFFEEDNNKYQKMLAFEGGNLFFAREELEDQDITTKNNIKPKKYLPIKILGIVTLISLIITTVITIICLSSL